MNRQFGADRHLEVLVRQNIRLARHLTAGQSAEALIHRVRTLTTQFGFSLALGDFRYLYGAWYVTHAGLLRLASRKRCVAIETEQIREFCDPLANQWVFKATVYKSPNSKGFVGFGDANPGNVSPLVRGAEMRVAETRAVNRALRKAYGIGLCSVEELGCAGSSSEQLSTPSTSHSNGNSKGQPRLRDRLCLLIRQHRLDPILVKRYATDFCGTQELREASRELIESFVTMLAQQVVKDRDGLICKLNGYRQDQEVKS